MARKAHSNPRVAEVERGNGKAVEGMGRRVVRIHGIVFLPKSGMRINVKIL
jgi:hypothetical protein